MRRRCLSGVTYIWSVWVVVIITAVWWCCHHHEDLFVMGQIYTFERELIPAPSPGRSFHVAAFFFIYGSEENPPSFLWLPRKTPTVTFDQVHLSDDSPSDFADYKSVEVTLLGASIWKEYYDSLKHTDLCCPPSIRLTDPSLCPASFHLARPTPKDVVFSVNVLRDAGSGHVVPEPKELMKTDTYVLLVSNCGHKTGATITGRVLVRNTYGYLPGLEFPKMEFYFWMSFSYLAVLITWTGLLLYYRNSLIHFHYCIQGVLLLSLFECVLQFTYFIDWNTNGTRNSALLVLSIFSTVVKNIFSYMLVLVASLGWGVTKPSLQRPTWLKIQAIVLLYIILDSIRQVTDDFIYSPHLPVAQFMLVVCCLIPISILNGIIFYWIFSSLTDLLEVLEEQKQFEKLQTFKRLLAVLIATLVLFTISLFVQIYAAASDVKARWQVHWWVSDGVPHMLFVLVLLVMMCLWKPNIHSRRLAYFQELPDTGDLDVTPNMGSPGEGQIWGHDLDESSTGEEDEEEEDGKYDIPMHYSHPVEIDKPPKGNY